jgi:hypothetical protein
MNYINFAQIDGLYNDQQRRVAAVIKDIFPTVRLIRMEPGHPQFNPEMQFALVDEPLTGQPYLITNIHEAEIDHRLVARLVENNMHDPNSKVNKLQLLEMAHAALEAKREEEWRAEKKDIMKSALKSNKNVWKHDGKTIRK